MQKKWKVGVIGAGYYSQRHLQAWQAQPNVELAGLCDLDHDRLQARAKQFNLPQEILFDSAARMLDEARLDFVDIITRPHTHPPLVRQAAEAGKHILCQKPFAESLQAGREMVETAKRHNVRLMVTENWVWLRPWQVLKQALQRGEAGQIHAVRFTVAEPVTFHLAPDRQPAQPYFREMPRLLLFEMGPHWFAVWRYLFGTPRSVFARIGRTSPHIIGEDHAVTIAEHGDFYGTLTMSWASREHRARSESAGPMRLRERMVIDGDRGTLVLEHSGELVRIDQEGNRTVLADGLAYDVQHANTQLQQHFMNSLDTGEPFLTSGEDNLLTLAMIFAAYDSAATGRPVAIEEQS